MYYQTFHYCGVCYIIICLFFAGFHRIDNIYFILDYLCITFRLYQNNGLFLLFWLIVFSSYYLIYVYISFCQSINSFLFDINFIKQLSHNTIHELCLHWLLFYYLYLHIYTQLLWSNHRLRAKLNWFVHTFFSHIYCFPSTFHYYIICYVILCFSFIVFHRVANSYLIWVYLCSILDTWLLFIYIFNFVLILS